MYKTSELRNKLFIDFKILCIWTDVNYSKK